MILASTTEGHDVIFFQFPFLNSEFYTLTHYDSYFNRLPLAGVLYVTHATGGVVDANGTFGLY